MQQIAVHGGVTSLGKDGRDSWRVTTTLTLAQKGELERIAAREGVKVAWLVRRAVERLIDQANGGPMLPFDLGLRDAER
jgi:hypothetical protein